ncbi:DNA polymerase I [Candidatus Parcubacteria bacterium]|nr:MAG: DNA polymerase I [Candidatus Parcubacteria bacterium]
MKLKRLVLIDSHAIIHRAFHALPPLSAPDGTPTNAAYGFTTILLKMLRELKPDYAIAAFDAAGPTFRHVAFERYKATRAKAPDALYQQIPVVKEITAAFGIPVIEKAGFEADDIIGTIAAAMAKKHPNIETIIVTGDLDTLQLVGPRTKVFTMKKGISDTVLYDAAAVRERFGLDPAALVDYKALRGDPSDNIPGVRGIGEKTAAALIARHGSVEELYRALKKSKEPIAKPGIVAALKTHEADALFSKTLATINAKVPIKFTLAAAKMRAADEGGMRALFSRLGFESLLRRLNGGNASAKTSVAAPTPGVDLVIREAARIADVPRDRHTVLVPDPAAGVLWAAADTATAYRIPLGPAVFRGVESWFSAKAHSFLYDRKWFLKRGLPAETPGAEDLMLMWWVSDSGRAKYEPEALASREFRGRAFAGLGDVARVLFATAPALEERLDREELWGVYRGMEYPLTPILAAMEERGIGFDAEPLRLLAIELEKELQRLERVIHGAAGEEFNIHSPRELRRILFEKLGLAEKGMRRTPGGGDLSTRESELAKLRGRHRIVGDILAWREIAKLKSTYVDTLPHLVAEDGRIHTTWNQAGTATGRLSSRDPNLQNIPTKSRFGKAIRSAFVAKPGATLMAFDYSQLELRLAADLAQDERMIEAFRKGTDIHALTAATVNAIPLDQVTPELRRKAKALNFGVLYGMGTRSFAESAGIPREEAEHFIEEYFRNFRGIAAFVEAMKEQARTHGFTKTAFGRKRYFPNLEATNFRLQREAERMAVNHPIQGTEADIMKRAMIAVDQYLAGGRRQHDAAILLQIHDELMLEVREDHVPAVSKEVRAIIEGAWQGAVPMEVRVKQGKHWGVLE